MPVAPGPSAFSRAAFIPSVSASTLAVCAHEDIGLPRGPLVLQNQEADGVLRFRILADGKTAHVGPVVLDRAPEAAGEIQR